MGRRRASFPWVWTAMAGLTAFLVQAGAAERQFNDWSDAQKEAFLLNAEIVEREDIGIGITGADRVTLESGGVRHDAQIQTVYEYKARMEFENGRIELAFTDYYSYNIAAYRLDRLIGLNMAPPAVERRVRGQDAAFVWWIDDVQMMEADRYLENITPPRPGEWGNQIRHANVFQELIYNTDAKNLQNTLITDDWQVRLIDFTRAFRTNRELLAAENLPNSIAPHIYEGLKSLTKPLLAEAMGDLLTGSQIDAVLARRDIIVEHFDARAEAVGREIVFR